MVNYECVVCLCVINGSLGSFVVLSLEKLSLLFNISNREYGQESIPVLSQKKTVEELNKTYHCYLRCLYATKKTAFTLSETFKDTPLGSKTHISVQISCKRKR